VVEALEAFTNGDAPRLGALAGASQRDAEELLGNQVPATSALAAAARSRGAWAACSFGAGFGGAVWALAPRDTSEVFAREWHPQALVITPGPPLTEVSAS
jgi:galactokinase